MKYLASTAIALVLVSYNVSSNPLNPMLSSVAEMGGVAEAAIKACEIDFDTKSAKAQQQQVFISMGGTQEAFETAYQSGIDRVNAEIEAASPADRQRMCDEFKKLASQGLPGLTP